LLQAEPKNVVLVHGEASKMDFLKQKIEKEFSEFLKFKGYYYQVGIP